MSDNPANVTQLLQLSAAGDSTATSRLSELLYQELRREAERQFLREDAGHTLQPTALIHESFLRLMDQRETSWKSREHFLGVAATMMRRILTDHARGRQRLKRGGDRQREILLDEHQLSVQDPDDILIVHDALQKLEQVDSRQARIVELRFFAGMSNAEVADVLDLSLRTVEAEWAFARAWLRKEMNEPQEK
ncbi:sigma-70 family RNA polymerase sigma factor [bacterium]|nr:sigma-70 family RNA polymerase sigma factor [bacterium]